MGVRIVLICFHPERYLHSLWTIAQPLAMFSSNFILRSFGDILMCFMKSFLCEAKNLSWYFLLLLCLVTDAS